MKRFIYIYAVMLLACGCEYHPYYDGQPLRIFNADCGIVETSGIHINVPIVSRSKFVISIYGGKGKEHSVTVEDTGYFSYTYEEADVDGGLMGDGIVPAKITITPHQLGETSMTISDVDTGESIQLFVHVVRTYSTLEVDDTKNSLPEGTVLAFEYGSAGDIFKMCRYNPRTGLFEYLYDGHFRFLEDDETLELELTYLADQAGNPDVNGEEVVKRFMVQIETYEGYVDAPGSLYLMNLEYLHVQTRDHAPVIDYDYYSRFRFVDITDNPHPDPESPEAKIFYAGSATLRSGI